MQKPLDWKERASLGVLYYLSYYQVWGGFPQT